MITTKAKGHRRTRPGSCERAEKTANSFFSLANMVEIAVTGVNLRVIGQDEELARDGTDNALEVGGRVGPARAMGKEGVSGKEMLPYQKAETARGVARGVKNLQARLSKRRLPGRPQAGSPAYREGFHVQTMDSYRDSESRLQLRQSAPIWSIWLWVISISVIGTLLAALIIAAPSAGTSTSTLSPVSGQVNM